jgi:hypothetical protein
MPNDSLREEIEPIRRGALAYLASNRIDTNQRRAHLRNLTNAEKRLTSEIDERSTHHLAELDAEEVAAIQSKREQVDKDSTYQRALQAQKAADQDFQERRQVNGGGYPRNISPVLYSIPLILVGVAEWYVNFATFSAIFIPVFAIAATIIVAAIFAIASDLHGAYLKQISEIIHPSVEYRNVLGRKLALTIATVALICAFITVVWLRWIVISDELGLNTGAGVSTFGGASSSMIWSRLGPTIIVNILIWVLGTLYSWAMHEKVPELREKYRDYLRASAVVDKKLKPFVAEEKRLNAYYERLRDKNKVALNEYTTLRDDIRSLIERLKEVKEGEGIS